MVLGTYACTDGPDDELGEVESEVALAPPTNLVVVNVRSDRQDLQWTTVPGTSKHIVFRGLAGPGSETTYTSCCVGETANTFIADHLLPNTNYCWQVANVNANGERSAKSNEVCLTTPEVPTVPPPAVTATAISASRIQVDWTAVTGATKYLINESVTGPAGSYVRVGSVIPSSLTFLRVNLAGGTNYCYTVEVETVDGKSAPSVPACATTFAAGLEGYWKADGVSGTTAVDSSGFNRHVTLSGGNFTNAVPRPPIDDNKSYLNFPSTSTAVGTAPVVNAFRLTGAFSVVFWANLPAGGDAKFMGMHNPGQCGAGAFGWEISQSAAGLAFISQTGVRNFGQSIPANTWTHVAVTFPGTGGSTMRMYINGVEVASTAANASNNLTTVPLQFGHAGGCAGAQVQLDEIQIYSRELTAQEVGVFGTVPPAPTNLVMTKNNSTVQDLAWTAPPTGATKWVIMRGVGANAATSLVNYTHAPNPPNTFNGDHLLPSTQYAWQVKTVQNNLVSEPSNMVVATTADPPAAPTGVTATPVSNSRIRVDWQPVAVATKYYIQMSTDGVNFAPTGSVLAPTVTFLKVNLTPNTTYHFRVQAEDAGLTKGEFSTPATATTPP